MKEDESEVSAEQQIDYNGGRGGDDDSLWLPDPTLRKMSDD